MPRRVIRTDKAPPPGGAYSQAVVAGNLVFTAGMVGVDPVSKKLPESVGEQTRQTLRNLRAALREAGTDLQNVVSVSAFLSDINDFDAYNSAYREFFVNDPPPRTTVQATLARGYKVEISLVAILP
ncbi:MAG: RidA family protein [Thaumarchaeota archaeon]|nr:MAG: RidA family protein [Nitrososphaerota archaeon]